VLYFLWERLGKAATISIMLVLLFTNLLHIAPYAVPFYIGVNLPAFSWKYPKGKVTKVIVWKSGDHLNPISYVDEFMYEITHDYDGPLEGICKYINQHAGPDDMVKIFYDNYAPIFYTNRLVLPKKEFEGPILPDWWIFRGRDWQYRLGQPNLEDVYRPILEREYEKITIDYPEIQWENMPEPAYHKFRTVKDAPRVIIYHRKKTYPVLSLEEKLGMIKGIWDKNLN